MLYKVLLFAILIFAGSSLFADNLQPIIPGGISSGKDLLETVLADHSLLEIYKDADFAALRPVLFGPTMNVLVAYRSGDQIVWRKELLRGGTEILLGGPVMIRAKDGAILKAIGEEDEPQAMNVMMAAVAVPHPQR